MVSYVNDLRLSELATGEGSGTWGTTTNTNLELIGEAFSFGTEAITTNADTHTTTIADGSTDPGRSMFLKYTGTLDSTCTITIGPNTVSKLWFIENATSGSQSIIIKQGSGATVTIANGQTKAIYSDGAGSGGAMVDAFQDLSVPDFFIEDDLTFTSDSAVITFGADGDTTLTHTDGSGLTLNSTNKIMFNDASQFIQGSSATVLSLGATDEIDLTATAIDVNGTMDVSGSLTGTTAVFTTDGNTTQLSLISTDEDENVGPRLDLRRDSASPAANDSLGTLRFMGKDSASGNFAYAFLQGFIVDPTDGSEDGKLLIETRLAGVNKERISMDATELVINENSMDLDFRVESDNNTHALFVQGSDGNVGVGTNSPDKTLHVVGSDGVTTFSGYGGRDFFVLENNQNCNFQIVSNSSNAGNILFSDEGASGRGILKYDHASDFMSFTTAATEAMRIDSSGNVGIGNSSPSSYSSSARQLVVGSGSGSNGITIASATNGSSAIFFADGTSSGQQYDCFISANHTDSALLFGTGSTGATDMTITSAGRVGIGTSAPSKPLEITDDTNDGTGGVKISSYLPTLEMDDISGGGTSFILQHDGTSTLFKHDTTERMRIDASGNLLVGNTSGTGKLEVYEAANLTEANPHFRIHGAGYSGFHWLDGTAYYIGQNSAVRALRLYSGAETAGVALTNGSTSWGTFSDERLKYDVEPIENALESLSELRTVKYRLKNVDEPDSQKKLGVVAQDLVGVLDEVLDPIQISDDDTEYMAVRYTELVPVLIKAIQEQQETITALTARIEQLENN